MRETLWMVHAWVVPGWDSPQGVFSHANIDLHCADGTDHTDKIGFCTGASAIFRALDHYVGDRLWRWQQQKHQGLKRKRTTIRRQPSLVRPTRKVWRHGSIEQFVLASLRVERFQRGWMITPRFALVPGEPDA